MLVALGAAGVPLYIALWRLGNLLDHAVAFLAIFAALVGLYAFACRIVLRDDGARLPRRGAILAIVVFALAYRIALAPAAPSLSDDFFRYVWDGFIQGQGYSPYRYPPGSAELAPLRDDYYWPRINRKEQTSAYPPFAELAYRALFLARPFSTAAFKGGFLALDLATIGLLAALLRIRGQSPLGAIVYAWHPLPIVEFAGSAHIDVLAVALIVAALGLEARGRHVAAGVALGLATLTKLYPGLLLPAFTRRERWRTPATCIATVIAGFTPAILSGDSNFRQLPTYLSEEGYGNGYRFFPLAMLRLIPHLPTPTVAYIATVGLALAALSAWLVCGPIGPGRLDVPRRAILLAGAIVLLVTPAYPWYFIWLIPLVAVVPVVGLWYLTGAVALSYLGWNWPGAPKPSLLPFLAAQYLPAYALLNGWRWRAGGPGT